MVLCPVHMPGMGGCGYGTVFMCSCAVLLDGGFSDSWFLYGRRYVNGVREGGHGVGFSLAQDSFREKGRSLTSPHLTSPQAAHKPRNSMDLAEVIQLT